ncbi:MAG: ABC transporter substrate-binding protein [Deltaproteobacteria bacterium]|nr:ABC transporter substrate-binding protein [Deltaproteobacteria bacterium]
MKKMAIRLFGIAAVIIAFMGIMSAEQVRAAEVIKIGWIADMGGIGASFYKSQKEGIEMFIEETNASGGFMGKKLELVTRDADLKPDVGANLARELILNEKCEYLIGPTSSAVALAATKVAKEFKKIIFFHTSNTEKLTTTDFHPYMFQVVPNTGIEGRGIAYFLAQKPYKNYGYIGLDYAYGHDQHDAFKESLLKSNPNAKITVEVWPKTGESNYGSYIPTLMAQNPEVIYSSLWGGALSTFIKQAVPYGLFKKTTLSSLYDLDMLRALGQEMPENLLGYTRCPFYAVDTPQMKAFVDKYNKKFKDWPADWAIMAYDGLLVLKKAVDTAGSTDSEKVSKALDGLKWESLRGERYLRAEDHMANVGIYVGVTAKDPKFKDFLVLKDVVEVPAEKVWMSVDEIKALRAKNPQ